MKHKRKLMQNKGKLINHPGGLQPQRGPGKVSPAAKSRYAAKPLKPGDPLQAAISRYKPLSR